MAQAALMFMFRLKLLFVVSSMLAGMISLQGCGKSVATHAPTPAPSVSTTSTTTKPLTPSPPPTPVPTPVPPPATPTPSPTPVVPTPSPTFPDIPNSTKHKPMSAEEAARKFNTAWKGFDENDPTSPLGVVMSLAAVETSFFENIFCNSYVNDKTHKHTGCNQAGTNKSKHEQGNGDADCRFSASLYNSKMLVDKETGLFVPALDRRVGYIFDFEKVENLYGKCSYPWDGGSWGRYNNGCGVGMDVASCDSPASAYKNICNSTNKVCTADDPEVTGAFCLGVEGGKSPIQHYPHPPTETPQCLFPGTAIDYHGQEYDELILRKSHLRDMAVTRAKFKDSTVNGSEHSRNAMFYANEVVIDVRLFLPHMKEDPARAIQAFVYLEEFDPEAKSLAKQMRDEYSQLLHVKLPILMISKSKNPPFVAVDETDDVAIMV